MMPQEKITVETVKEFPAPPKASGLPILGNALDFLNRPMDFFLENYRRFGPIFRIQALNQKFVVIAGLEANQFLARQGEEHFTSEPLFGEFGRQMGAKNFLVSLDGKPHRHMRKVMQRGYSKGGIAPHLDNFVALTGQRTAQWQPGDYIFVRDQMQRLVSEQIGWALANYSAAPHFEAIRTYLNTLLNVFVIKRWPKFMIYAPRYRKAKKEAMAMSRRVLEEHRAGSNGRSHDLIDDLLAAEDWNGRPLSEDDLLAATIGPFFAGMDTVASTIGFMLYAILATNLRRDKN